MKIIFENNAKLLEWIYNPQKEHNGLDLKMSLNEYDGVYFKDKLNNIICFYEGFDKKVLCCNFSFRKYISTRLNFGDSKHIQCSNCGQLVEVIQPDDEWSEIVCEDCFEQINIKWPRIRDLPKEEQEPFSKWLYGQTCPFLEGEEIQDGYYSHDYDRWKLGLPIID